MEHPRVDDGEDSLLIWRVAANILRYRGQPTKGGSPAWDWARG